MTAVELRLPELSGGTTQEQLRRMQSYLYTLAQQLQIAFDTVTQQSDSSKQQADSPSSGQENPAVDFAAVKALILKSAEITQHFQQQVEKSLSGSYVAQSQFGVFRQETEQRITANAQSIQQKFSNIQQLEAAVAELTSSMVEVNATIRTGLLTQGPDGADIYGVEIGQQEWEDGVIRFRKFTRLTASRLSFFDSNDVEVAYISDRRLYVTAIAASSIQADSAQVGWFQLGDYIWEQGVDGHLSIR